MPLHLHDRLFALGALGLAAMVHAAAPVSAAGPPRPMAVDDLFRIEQFGEVAVAPDGRGIAFVRERPMAPGEVYRNANIGVRGRADLYLMPAAGGEPRRLTDGARDGAGFWHPVWSPDGRRIAVLSTRGGDDVRLEVWEAESGRLARASARGIDLWAVFGESGRTPFAWLDGDRLICAVMPEGEPHWLFDIATERVAPRAWAKARRGAEPTASVVESGPDAAAKGRPRGQLLLVDLRLGTATVLLEGDVRHVLSSPDGRHLAVVTETEVIPPRAGRPVRYPAPHHSRLAIVNLGDGSAPRWVDEVRDPAVVFNQSPHAWSHDSKTLAVLAKSDRDDDRAEAVFLVAPSGPGAIRVGREDERATALAWTPGNDLLVRSSGGGAGPGGRQDWRRVDRAEPRASGTNLTARMGASPDALLGVAGTGRMIGLAGGKLWGIDAAVGDPVDLTAASSSSIESILWPIAGTRTLSGTTRLVVTTRSRDTSAAVRISLASIAGDRADLTPAPCPDDAAFADYHAPSGLLAATTVRPDGTSLWTADEAGGPRLRVGLNGFLGDVADVPRRLIDYRGGGRKLKALAALPVDYEPGRRYPVVVWVYPGLVVAGDDEFELRKNNPTFLNLNLLTARGYAVLVPSIPLEPTRDESGDLYSALPAGVLGAIDALVDAGVADPARVAVMGHSFGGYAVYGLISQTDRFRAAIALAGAADLAAEYGVFDARMRYTEFPQDSLIQPTILEAGQAGRGGMLGPPWDEPFRYLRNSPIQFVERVHTPVLIVQGDNDYVSIAQGEAFFTSLHRLGKRARFARYWGEGHRLQSPANIRHMWGEVFAWLEQCLGADGKHPIQADQGTLAPGAGE
jgi:dipeptidyl aminopeptidase/acylaminoacyl peptidase